jgi:hypothetical protein
MKSLASLNRPGFFACQSLRMKYHAMKFLADTPIDPGGGIHRRGHRLIGFAAGYLKSGCSVSV